MICVVQNIELSPSYYSGLVSARVLRFAEGSSSLVELGLMCMVIETELGVT